MKRKNDRGFPDRAAIVAFIKANPGKVGTREIAREFGLKNADRIELKRMLRELADDGPVKKSAIRFQSRTASRRRWSPTLPAATPTASWSPPH